MNGLAPNDYEDWAAGMAVALTLATSAHNRMERNMTEKKNWKLQPGVNLTPEVIDDVAKIACALKSLSSYTTFAMEREDCPEDLQQLVDEGLEAMARIFQW
jgi:hypothetical protein